VRHVFLPRSLVLWIAGLGRADPSADLIAAALALRTPFQTRIPRGAIRKILILVVLTSCATSYESATSSRPIGPNAFLITADGNGFTSRSEIVEYQYRRAAALCPDGFDVIDADRSTRSSLATFDGGQTYTTINKPSGAMAVRCKSEAPPVRRQAGKWWCSTHPDTRVGLCERDIEHCKEFRARGKAGGHDFPPCRNAPVAFCFASYSRTAKYSGLQCAPTADGCSKLYELSKADSDGPSIRSVKRQ
jgi:hypothetical protein